MTLPTITTGYAGGNHYAEFRPDGYLDNVRLYADTKDAAIREAWKYLEDLDRMHRKQNNVTALPTQIDDPVNHPKHYTSYGAEVIEITEHLNFCRGNAVKYITRAGLKHPANELEDLRKAVWYLNREIARIERANSQRQN